MGLDMYAYTTLEQVKREVDFDVKECESLHYWCKHPDLHGMMRALYTLKGGQDIYFNCSNLALRLDDITIIEEVILRHKLPVTEGYFFGVSDGSEWSNDLAFIDKARIAIKSGLTVFYRAWW